MTRMLKNFAYKDGWPFVRMTASERAFVFTGYDYLPIQSHMDGYAVHI